MPLNTESNKPRIFRNVDLPDPEGPDIEITSPLKILKFIFF